jgi:hypothetical protein
MSEPIDLTEAIEAARRVLGWGDTSAEMDRAIPKLAEIVARHVERQVRDRIFADIEALKVINWGGFQLVRKAQVNAAVRGDL